ncbi:MAG: hypothetical protein KDE27_18020, partial [Planctomycetes bacterium]|nr:hypothetical protein [Planctomycetota bacterium]
AMADAYSILLVLLLLLALVSAAAGALAAVRRREPPAQVRAGALRGVAWILGLAVVLLLGDCVLLLLCDCSLRDFTRELRWWPSLQHASAVVHRLALAAGAGLAAAALAFPAIRGACRRPLTSLRNANARRAAAPLPGSWVLAITLALGAVALLGAAMQDLAWLVSADHWQAFEHARGLDDLDLGRIVRPLAALPLAWGSTRLALGLLGQERLAWWITLALAGATFAWFAVLTGWYVHRSLQPRSSMALGTPELGVPLFAAPAAFAAWALWYLVTRRRQFGSGVAPDEDVS